MTKSKHYYRGDLQIALILILVSLIDPAKAGVGAESGATSAAAVGTQNTADPQVLLSVKVVETSEELIRKLGIFEIIHPTGTDQKTNSVARAVTDPEFRAMIKGLEHSPGISIISAPLFTTLVGRKAQVRVADSHDIDDGSDLSRSPRHIGMTNCTVEVVPKVWQDGYTISLSLVAGVSGFIGYKLNPEAFFLDYGAPAGSGLLASQRPAIDPVLNPSLETVPADLRPAQEIPPTLAQSFSHSRSPIPIFGKHRVEGQVVLWDGQSAILWYRRGPSPFEIQPNVGDLPIAGRFFRNKSAANKTRELLIFVTPTIIDSAGNPVHTPNDLPIRQTKVPLQLH
jgi:Flp pilus assembly secretin CpaC